MKELILLAALAGSPAWDQPIPPQYDREPEQPVTIWRTDHIDSFCQSPPGWRPVACSSSTYRSCHIFLNFTYPPEIDEAVLLRHEKAHCNGWSSDHSS